MNTQLEVRADFQGSDTFKMHQKSRVFAVCASFLWLKQKLI